MARCHQIDLTTLAILKLAKEDDGLRIDQVKRFKELEQENARLKRLLADTEPDKANLRDRLGNRST